MATRKGMARRARRDNGLLDAARRALVGGLRLELAGLLHAGQSLPVELGGAKL